MCKRWSDQILWNNKNTFFIRKNKYLSNFVVDCILVFVVNDKLDIKIRKKEPKDKHKLFIFF